MSSTTTVARTIAGACPIGCRPPRSIVWATGAGSRRCGACATGNVPRAWCARQGVTARLLEGAVAYAASHGAPAVEGYPVDPPGRMDLTMAFVGTRSMFDRAGFRVVGTTDAVASGMPRLAMRRDLP